MKKILKNKKSIILILLSIIIIFNFVTLPQKAEAIAFTLGGIAITYKVAEAIYLFVLASAAVGVTYATWQEAKNVYEMYEGTSPGPYNNPEWQEKAQEVKQSKADLAMDHWFDQWELQIIPGGQQDPDPGNDNKRAILGLIGGAGIMSVVLNKFKDLFGTLGLEEGENILPSTPMDNSFYVGGFHITFEHILENKRFITNMVFENGYRTSIRNTNDIIKSRQVHNVTVTKESENIYTISVDYSEYKEDGTGTVLNSTNNFHISDIGDSNPDLQPPINEEDGKLNVKPNSPVLDSGPYLTKPQQPNLIPIRRIEPTILPDGSKEIVYKEGIDELIKDVVLNTPIDKILNPEPYPYTIRPGKNGQVIIKPVIDPTVPYPDPLPQPAPEIPYPDPSLPPGINPGEYPGPGPYPWLPPLPLPGIEPGEYPGPGPYPDLPGYPDPDLPPGINPGEYPGPGPYPGIDPPPEPGIDPGQYPGPGPYPFPHPDAPPMTEVDTGFMINYIPWLKVIINWLSMIWHKIPWVPEVDPEEDTVIDPDPGEDPGLILPSDDFLQEKLLDLETQIKEKLGIPDLQPIGDMFGGIQCMPLESKTANLTISGGKSTITSEVSIVIVDKVNELAPQIANLQRILWWTIIILMSLNNGYKLIRGTDLITIKGPGGKGNHYKGS